MFAVRGMERGKRVNILVVNDDSVYAPGIAMLAKAAAALGDVWVAAPAEQCSALSQKLTLREQLSVRQVQVFPAQVRGAWAVGGTPVDCVKVALDYLLDVKPDLVLSGINNGYNAGFDVAYSATVGAAFEAVRNGIPAIAFSIVSDAYLPAAEPYLLSILRELAETKAGAGEIWNVNFPAMKNGEPVEILRDRPLAPTSMYIEKYIESIQPDGTVLLTCKGIPTPNSAIPAGSDAEAVRRGCISIGRIKSTGWQ